MNTSLYVIEDSLQQLVNLRETAELEGDSEALKVIDQQISDYLTREAAKVDSYVGLIRRREDDAQLIQEEIIRLKDLRARAEADVARLKETAQGVMQRFGVTQLKSRTHSLRVQGNGGVQAIEVSDEKLLPVACTDAELKISAEDWNALWIPSMETLPTDLRRRIVAHLSFVANRSRIRQALERKEEVPGARLLPRGVHLICE